MTDDEEDKMQKRVKYYGLRDLATSFYLKPAMELLDSYNESRTDYDINDILELYNVFQYVENLAIPRDTPKGVIDAYIALKPKLLKTIATFFNSITETTLSTVINKVNFDYHDDLLILLARYKKFDDISASVMLDVLDDSEFGLWSFLENREIVNKYGDEIRARILSNPENAEHLVHKYLEKGGRREVHLPKCFTKNDAHTLIESYVNGKDANPNYLQLIATARVTLEVGIDDKLKLLAKRKHEAWTDEFFKDNTGGVTFGCEVRISEEQEEAVDISSDGTTTRFTYSKKWLEEHSDNVSILGNFINLFAFANKHIILTLPSYESQLGVTERYMKVAGKDEYPEGIHFQFIDQSTLMQTIVYERFLRSQNKGLEDVISWYFSDYLKDTFGAEGFSYLTSTKDSTYFEKCKHVFSEMDSVIKQFKLYVENGIIDQGLLSITSDSPKYKDIPSKVTGKYAYITDIREIFTILHYLFSDQSSLNYIRESLKGKDLVDLLMNNKVKYDDFHDHQKPALNELIKLGILKKTPKQLEFRSTSQVTILKNLFSVEALSYYHYSEVAKAKIDEMVSKKWLVKKESLLTQPEARYFSYYLNQQDSSNGHDLRNIYLHGSMSSIDKADEDKHYRVYITALKLFIALIIKIDDDLSAHLR